MKVIVDFDRCEANGLCEEVCPDVFRLDDNDELHINEANVRPDDDDLRDAARICPRGAITLQE